MASSKTNPSTTGEACAGSKYISQPTYHLLLPKNISSATDRLRPKDDLGHGLPDPPRQIGPQPRRLDPRRRLVSPQVQTLEIRHRPQRHRIPRHVPLRPRHRLVRPPHGARIETAQSRLQTHLLQGHCRHHPHPGPRLPIIRPVPVVPPYAVRVRLRLRGRHPRVHDVCRDVCRFGRLFMEFFRGTVSGVVGFVAEDEEPGGRICGGFGC